MVNLGCELTTTILQSTAIYVLPITDTIKRTFYINNFHRPKDFRRKVTKKSCDVISHKIKERITCN